MFPVLLEECLHPATEERKRTECHKKPAEVWSVFTGTGTLKNGQTLSVSLVQSQQNPPAPGIRTSAEVHIRH